MPPLMLQSLNISIGPNSRRVGAKECKVRKSTRRRSRLEKRLDECRMTHGMTDNHQMSEVGTSPTGFESRSRAFYEEISMEHCSIGSRRMRIVKQLSAT